MIAFHWLSVFMCILWACFSLPYDSYLWNCINHTDYTSNCVWRGRLVDPIPTPSATIIKISRFLWTVLLEWSRKCDMQWMQCWFEYYKYTYLVLLIMTSIVRTLLRFCRFSLSCLLSMHTIHISSHMAHRNCSLNAPNSHSMLNSLKLALIGAYIDWKFQMTGIPCIFIKIA